MLGVYILRRIYHGLSDGKHGGRKPGLSHTDSASQRKRKHDNRLDPRESASNKKKRMTVDLEKVKFEGFSPVLRTRTSSGKDSPQ